MTVVEDDENGAQKKEHKLPFRYSMVIPAFKGVDAVAAVPELCNPRGFVVIDEHQLVFERPQVARGVVAVGGADDEHERVAVAQRPEQPAAEALARLGRQARQERDLERRVDDLLRLRHRGQRVEPVVGEVDHPEHPVGREVDVHPREGTEEARVPGVRQADQSEVLHAAGG